MSHDGYGTVEIFPERFLKSCTPARDVGRQTVKRESNGIEFETGIDSAATIETTFRIRVIEILNNSRHTHALEFIQLVFQSSHRKGAEIQHKKLPHQSTGVCQPLWEKI